MKAGEQQPDSVAQKRRIEQLGELVNDLEQGRVVLEELPEDLLERMEKALNAGKRRRMHP